MAIWDEPLAPTLEGPTPAQVAQPQGAPPATPTPVAPAPTSSAAFRVPYLGAVLDTGRDLLVGPGNERLTTQEQITRAILNTIVLAKAPQSLGAVYSTNQQRDAQSLNVLGSPQFQDRIDELMVSKLPEADAIKQAAREFNVDTGLSLPTSRAGLPPRNLAESLQYSRQKQSLQDLVNLGINPPPKVGPDIPDDRVIAALRRRQQGLQLLPGDDAIIASVEAQERAKVPNPLEPKIDPTTGQRLSPTTGLPIEPIGGVPPSSSPALTAPPGGAVPSAPGVPGGVSLGGSLRDEEGGPARRLTNEEINHWSWKGVPETYLETRFNPATQKDEVVEKPMGYAERAKIAKDNADALRAFEDRKDAAEQENIKNRREALTKQQETVGQINMATNDLLRFVEDPKTHKPRYDVFVQKNAFPATAEGYVKSWGYTAQQKLRASWLARNIEGNQGIATFVSREGLAAQILARIITKDRVSEQDWQTFVESLPSLDTPHDRASEMIKDIPKQFEILLNSYMRSLEGEERALEERRLFGREGVFSGKKFVHFLQDTGEQSPESTPSPTPEPTPADLKKSLKEDGWN